jgi:hypothetical protein
VLGKLKIEVLASGRESQFIDVQQKFSGESQSLIDVVTLVQIRVVDESLPTDAGAWLLEVGSHEHDKFVFETACVRKKLFSVLEDGFRIVNTTRSHDNH